MESLTWLWLLPLLPLVGSACAGTLHFLALSTSDSAPPREGLGKLAATLACGVMAAAFGLALYAFFQLAGTSAYTALESTTWAWIDAGSFQVDLSLVVDRLSSVMALVITGVGLLIHVYSTGYMKGDPGYAKFFAYLNLFVFAMLMLVLSSSLLGLFVGWEGVGLCSYLLIGFWYEKGWPAEAGQKAFVVNRIGDASFLLGSFLLIGIFGTLDLSDIASGVQAQMSEHSGMLAVAALLLFGGACGKSAQFPLFTWLPDAMAGPTPVSALIHAATMVTAGVYLLLRLNPLYAAAPTVMFIVGCVGALTALIGATTALMQRDIKKVLAYSTVSQLGYMFLGVSTGAWAAALFHLVTHAFFKGLLFLGSGSVIHGMHEEQDMYKMGGLKKHMPRTYVTFLAGAAALSGLPLMSGYFSKDEILAHAFTHGGPHLILWIVGIVSAACTAFYTWRMVALTFHGEERFDPQRVHPHESPSSMTVPLILLAVLALGGGLLNLPPLHLPLIGGIEQALHSWISPVTAAGDAILYGGGEPPHAPLGLEIFLLLLGAGIALFFAHRGFWGYVGGPGKDDELREKRPREVSFLEHAWTIDETYMGKIVSPLRLLSYVIATLVDQLAIDGAVNGSGKAALKAGRKLRVLVDGSVKSYALWMGAGAALLTVVWIWS